MAYCGYLVNREYDKMYPMEYPLYRKNVSLVQYIQQMANPTVKFGSCKVSNIAMDNDRAKVDLSVTMDFKVPGAEVFRYKRGMSDKWVRIDGDWYHVLGGVKTPAHENK